MTDIDYDARTMSDNMTRTDELEAIRQLPYERCKSTPKVPGPCGGCNACKRNKARVDLLAALDANDKAQAVARLSGSYSAAHVNGVADELDKADFGGAAKMLRNLLARHKRMLRSGDAALDAANQNSNKMQREQQRVIKGIEAERDELRAALERAPENDGPRFGLADWDADYIEWYDKTRELLK